jgi:tRNA A-37 threonylcarbamoyl transferase component Bud32
MSILIKTINYEISGRGQGKVGLEVELQKRAYKYVLTPKIYDVAYNDEQALISMKHLNEMCIADKYGDQPENISEKIWEQIHIIIDKLYNEAEIEYIDITPYNFIEKDNKIYIIDFGDAYYRTKSKKINWFLEKFLNGFNGWNPDFE